MTIATKTLFTKLLPALALPAILLTSLDANAATLDVSNGFITAATYVSPGHWTFTVGGTGVVTVGGQNVASAVEFDCETDSSVENIDCVGELTIGGIARDILMGIQDGNAYWAIEADAPTTFKTVHEQWGLTVVPNAFEGVSDWVEAGIIEDQDWTIFYNSVEWDFSFLPIIQRASTHYFED